MLPLAGVKIGPCSTIIRVNGTTRHITITTVCMLFLYVICAGVKIGPCGTIICVDGTILCADGHPAPPGFGLNADKTRILDPQGAPVEDSYSMGPNG